MKTKMNRALLLVCSMLWLSCAASLYDHFTLTETIETKVQAVNLIKQSINPYTDHVVQVQTLKDQLQKMVTYEKAKNKNEITLRMWEFINSENSSIHKFLKLWKERETLNPVFTEEFSKEVIEQFDSMISYEAKKDKQSKSTLETIVNAL